MKGYYLTAALLCFLACPHILIAKEVDVSSQQNSKSTSEKIIESGEKIAKPVLKVKEETDKVIGKTLEATEPLTLEPIQKAVDKTRKSLPDEIELLSSDEDGKKESAEKDLGPKLKMTF